MYHAALRPEEAFRLTETSLVLPAEGMGWITMERAAPDAGKQWTDSGRARDERGQLKNRAIGETRRVPSPPELTAILDAPRDVQHGRT
jgi:hypothetical protein